MSKKSKIYQLEIADTFKVRELEGESKNTDTIKNK